MYGGPLLLFSLPHGGVRAGLHVRSRRDQVLVLNLQLQPRLD